MTPVDPSKYQRQLELEREMQGMGIARFREEVQKARDKGLESSTTGVLTIMKNAFEPLEQGIKDWKKGREDRVGKAGEPGYEGASYAILKDIKDDVLAFLTLKTVMDNISKSIPFQQMTISIATQIQNELNFKEFKAESPNHYKKVKDDVMSRGTDSKHISKVVKMSAKKDEVDLTTFSVKEKHHIGSILLSLVIETTGLVEVYSPPTMPGKKSKLKRVQPTESTTEWLKKHNARCELLSPVVMPMIVEPKPWSTPFDGGFWSPHINTALVRRVPNSYLEEISNIDMWQVYQAVNHLQKTKWKVNTDILEVMKTCADSNNSLGHLPSGAEIPLPPKPATIAEDAEVRWLWRKEASRVYGANVRARSKFISLQKKLQIAEKFAEEDEIYFVYSLDFRGRIYPIQVHLSPQGDDVSKALLYFAEGKPIDDESGAWLALHGANTFGYDKVSLQQRVEWTKTNQDKMVECAKDPYNNQWWTEADKPWQFLAFCFEWKRFVEDPEGFVSRIPVALDGSCNGLQNFSAMLRDPIGGKATNLTPTEEPQDIYAEVAEVVKKKVASDILSGVPEAKCWEGFINRKLVKRPTMTMPYGATLTGYKDQISDEIMSWRDEGKPVPNFQDNGFGYKECFYLAKVVKASLEEVVVAAKDAMNWLQDVAKIVSQENLPIYWFTPAGFPVMQNYRNLLTSRVQTEVAGRLYRVAIAERAGTKMNKRKMKASIAPNFVHSCDASHLMRTVNLCDINDIPDLAMVHDSFGTHAADTPKLRVVLRHAFVQTHEEDPLNQFYLAMKEQVQDPSVLPLPPTKGTLDINQVLEADYFFS